MYGGCVLSAVDWFSQSELSDRLECFAPTEFLFGPRRAGLTTEDYFALVLAERNVFVIEVLCVKAALPKVLARQYRGAIPLSQVRAISFRLRASAETTEEVKLLSPVKVLFRVLVFLLIAIGGTVVTSRLLPPKKGVACCSAEVCARNHHHE